MTAKRLRLTSLKVEIPTTNTAIRPWISEMLNRGYAPLEEGSGMNPLWLTSILPADRAGAPTAAVLTRCGQYNSNPDQTTDKARPKYRTISLIVARLRRFNQVF